MSKAPQDQQVVVYKSRRGEEVKLSMEIVKNFLVVGNKDLVTAQEFMYYMGVCRARGLNPFAKDCYLIKYGQEPAAIIVAIDFYRSRAKAQADCVGWEAGVICLNKKTGELRYSKGIVLKDEELVGGWFRAQPKGWMIPMEKEVNLDGYIKLTKEGKVTAFWAPAKQPTQIAKVAESQGLRSVWPDEFQGTVTAEEMGLQLDQFETMDLKGLPGTQGEPEPEPIDTSAFDKLVEEKLTNITTAEEYKVRFQRVQEKVAEIARLSSTKEKKVTSADIKLAAAKNFDGPPEKRPFWLAFETWEAKKYPAPAAAAASAFPAGETAAGPPPDLPATENECFAHGKFVGDECPECAQERGAPPATTTPPAGAAGTGPDPTFEGRRLALWDSIIDKQIPLSELADPKFGVSKLMDITPENFVAVKCLADNYQPKKRGKK